MTIPVYLIASPIGDYLQDMSLAAIHTLGSVTHVFVEANDNYLARLRQRGVIGDQQKVHFLDRPQVDQARELIVAKEPFAIMASSGIPCFVDPGRQLVSLCLDHHPQEVELIPIGVSSALDAALCMCGLNVDVFHFYGHYPEHHVFERALPDDGIPLVYFVRGDTIGDFLHQVDRSVSHLRRVILFRDIRKKGRAQVTVLPWPLDEGAGLPTGSVAVDFTCVIDRSRASERPPGE